MSGTDANANGADLSRLFKDIKLPMLQFSGLPDEIANRLGSAIRRGILRPGDRIATERSLCAELQVSRPVIREAISRLRSEGLVVTHQGKGVFVGETRNWSFFRLPAEFGDQRADLFSVLELWGAVSSMAAELAAERRTTKELKLIRQALLDMETAIREGQLGAEADFQFHQEIENAARNPLFASFSEFMSSRVQKLMHETRSNTAHFGGLPEEVQKEHVAIYEAIAGRKPQLAYKAANRHVRNTETRLRQLYLT
jgi:GntR family transcriptional regulator, transcriptional repressor for pyruvate dehydrogenase complex